MATDFAGDLSHFLEYGHILEIEAKSLIKAKYFHIDVCTAKSIVNPIANIGLRFSCYFDETFIRRNARNKSDWGTEEIEIGFDGNLKNPFIAGDNFKIVIACSNCMFYITVNEQPFCTFKYRFALEMLRCLEINGDIEMLKRVNHRAVFPLAWPQPKMYNYAEHIFTNDVPKKFQPGRVIVMTARCFGKKGRFAVDFYGADFEEILFHLSVRFDRNNVVRNSQQNVEHGWLTEERDGGFPFVFNEKFKLAIALTKTQVLVAVNGYKYCSFVFRVPDALQKLTTLSTQTSHGLHMHTNGIDHVQMDDNDCIGFEKYSGFDYLGRRDIFETQDVILRQHKGETED